MQWDTSKQAGFTTSDHPWLPVPPSAAEYNVETESRDPQSILSFYKKLLALRSSNGALRDGNYVPLDQDDPFVLAYLRKNAKPGQPVLVVLNMSGETRTVDLGLAAKGISEKSAQSLLAAPEISGDSTTLNHFTIPAFGVFVGTIR